RTGVTSSTLPLLTVGVDAHLAGQSIILDSTSGTLLDPRANLLGEHISLGSGQIDLVLSGAGPANANTILVLSGAALLDLQSHAQSLSFLSYSSIDIYGSGQLGTLDSNGMPIASSLALHAADVRGMDTNDGRVVLAAKEVTLDNSPGLAPPTSLTSNLSGSLEITAETIHLGANQMQVDNFADVNFAATNEVVAESSGAISVPNNLRIETPVITGSTAAHETIAAAGNLELFGWGTNSSSQVRNGLGASLNFNGSTVLADTTILAPSGSIALRATGSDLTVGGRLDAAGTVQTFFDLQRFTDGGRINLSSDNGNVVLLNTAVATVAAQPEAGDAGTLAVASPHGNFVLNGTIA